MYASVQAFVKGLGQEIATEVAPGEEVLFITHSPEILEIFKPQHNPDVKDDLLIQSAKKPARRMNKGDIEKGLGGSSSQ